MKKNFKMFFGFVIAVVMMILGGNGYAMANDSALTSPVGKDPGNTGVLDGPGTGVNGGHWQGDSQEIVEGHQDYDWYQKEINKRIIEMKLESCPIDQILCASSRTNRAGSMIVKYYQIGQRPIKSTISQETAATTTGTANTIYVANTTVFDAMDTILFPTIPGYLADGKTEDPLKPLMVRVIAQSTTLDPQVIAINGKKNQAKGNNWDLPKLVVGTPLLRLGRAAGEKDVETASYYELPDPSEQYCQRFIMQAEESIIERMTTKVVDWDFTKQERVAMDDMRDGMERSGLFGIKSMTRYGKNGNVYTTGGIYWEAGKDITLGHWQQKVENGLAVKYTNEDDEELDVYEYVITEKELTAFVNEAIQDAGNGSRTKMLFVDNLIYQALSNLKSEKRIIMESETNYENVKLDFESFKSMGTKIMIYRHDAFNYMGMSGSAFLLDPRYLEKWVFGDWQRKEYNLKDLFVRNSNAVVMEEFSCWTLYFPNAHARVHRAEYSGDGITDEAIVLAA